MARYRQLEDGGMIKKCGANNKQITEKLYDEETSTAPRPKLLLAPPRSGDPVSCVEKHITQRHAALCRPSFPTSKSWRLASDHSVIIVFLSTESVAIFLSRKAHDPPSSVPSTPEPCSYLSLPPSFLLLPLFASAHSSGSEFASHSLAP